MISKLTKKQCCYILLTILSIISIVILVFSINLNTKISNISLVENKNFLLENTATEIIMPEGSTSDDLFNVLTDAGYEANLVITLTSDLVYTTTTPLINFQYETNIILQSNAGNNWKIIQTNPNSRHFEISGNVIFRNITLDGSSIGGGVMLGSNSLTLESGTVIQNCYSNESGGAIASFQGARLIIKDCLITNNHANWGGGIYMYGMLYMSGGTITNNTATYYGGGIGAHQTLLYIIGGEISNNTALNNHGGGIYVDPVSAIMDPIISNVTFKNNRAPLGFGGGLYASEGNVIITNSEFNDNYALKGGGYYAYSCSVIDNCVFDSNIAEESGGGIYFYNIEYYFQKDFSLINGTTIKNNVCNTGDGGGIYLEEDLKLYIRRNSIISNNSAPTGNGGGIYVLDENYSNLFTESSIRFNLNTANEAYIPPENASTIYPNIAFFNTSISKHPINNYDINNLGDILRFNISYNSNGGTGSFVGPDTKPTETDTVLSVEETSINLPEHTFKNWNTKPDDTGTSYLAGDIVNLNDNITLYAIWLSNINIVTFESNGGTNIDNQEILLNNKIIKPDDPEKKGYTFVGWFTDNQSFYTKWNFDNVVTENLTLYAKWEKSSSFNIFEFICMFLSALFILGILFFKKLLKCLVWKKAGEKNENK